MDASLMVYIGPKANPTVHSTYAPNIERLHTVQRTGRRIFQMHIPCSTFKIAGININSKNVSPVSPRYDSESSSSVT